MSTPQKQPLSSTPPTTWRAALKALAMRQATRRKKSGGTVSPVQKRTFRKRNRLFRSSRKFVPSKRKPASRPVRQYGRRQREKNPCPKTLRPKVSRDSRDCPGLCRESRWMQGRRIPVERSNRDASEWSKLPAPNSGRERFAPIPKPTGQSRP